MADDVLQVLWQISWHAAAAAGVVLVGRAAVGRAVPGRWRHALWAVVLVRLLMPAAPTSRASLFNLWSPAPRRPAAAFLAPTVTRSVTPESPAESDPVPAPPAPAARPPRWPAVVTTAWLAVAAGLLVRLVVSNVRFGRTLRRTAAPATDRLAAAFEAGRRDMRAGRRAALVVTDAVATPAACGVLRPRVLVPASLARSLSDERARLVFLHEFAHVRCHDVAVDWAWAVLRSVYWFNPVVWLVGPLRRHDREVARDEMVLSVVGPAGAESYGRMLLDLARPGRRPVTCPGLVGLLDGRGVRDRVRRVAESKAGRRGSAVAGAVVLAVAAWVLLTNPHRRGAAVGPSPTLEAVVAVDPDAPSPATAATLAKLDRKLPELRFNANKLSDVVDFLRDTTRTNLYVDWRSLKATGVTRDSPVTARLRDIKLSNALQLLFKSVEDDARPLGYAVDEGVITISTQRELDKNTNTRRYDVNDLLFVPSDYQPGKAPVAPSREQRVGEIVQYVEQNVAPNSWKDRGGTVGSISSSPLRAILLVTQTADNQRKVRSVLDSLWASQALQVSVEARVVTVDPADVGRLPEDVRRVLTGNPRLLTPTQAAAVLAATTPSAVAVPRLTVFSGQRAAVSTMDRRPFTTSYTAVVRPAGGGTAYEPVVTPVDIGLSLDVQATVSPDRRFVFVDLHSVLSRLADVTTEPWPGGPPAVVVQRPVVLTSATQTKCSIPDGSTLLLSCGGYAPAAPEPAAADPATAAEVDRARQTLVFLLVRPTVLMATDQRTFPMLDRRVP